MRNDRYERHERRHEYRRHDPFTSLWKGFMLLVIGCVLIAVGLSLGGRWTNVPWLHGFHFGDWDFEANRNDSGISDIRDVEELNGEIPADIGDVEIRLKAASLVVRYSEAAGAGSYQVIDFEKGSLEITREGNRLRIEERDWQHTVDFGNDFPKPTVTLTLPAGIALTSFRVNMGAGSATFDSVVADDFSVESGAGSFKGDGVKARKVNLEAGAGSIEFNGCEFGESRVSAGAGRFVFSGTLGDFTDVSTGAGAVEMKINGNANDYRIDFDRGIGSVRIDGESFSGIGHGSSGNRTAPRKIKLSSGVGSVRLDFGAGW
jgi:hypothetical protein